MWLFLCYSTSVIFVDNYDTNDVIIVNRTSEWATIFYLLSLAISGGDYNASLLILCCSVNDAKVHSFVYLLY
ncbi:hypothetical protein D3C85_901090 [compost metagenome]